MFSENVALHKNTSISSIWKWKHDNNIKGYGCRGNNGDINGSARSENNCVHTNFGDYQPSWNVSLGSPYLISKIDIYTSNG